jgi:hypothetical protein
MRLASSMHFIAETAVGLGVALATFNDRHYRVVSTLHTIQPYERL